MPSESACVIAGRPLVRGEAGGTVLVLEDGLSFAMAVDVSSGRITDVRSPRAGDSVSGRVLVVPMGRGSSSASTSLAEAIRLGTAPAGIVLHEADEILAVGAIVARTLYDKTCPIVVVDAAAAARIADGDHASIGADGNVSVRRS